MSLLCRTYQLLSAARQTAKSVLGWLTARGHFDTSVAVYAIDPGRDKGFVTSRGATKIRALMDRAEELGVPIVALLASAGVSIEEGLASGDAYTRVITGNVRLSGVVPQLGVVMGVAMGAPAYSATLMDLAILNRARSHLMVTGPAVVERMLGESPTLAELGGSHLHAAKTGLAKKPDPSIAPLGHFVLADVYSRQGKENEAAREHPEERRRVGPVQRTLRP